MNEGDTFEVDRADNCIWVTDVRDGVVRHIVPSQARELVEKLRAVLKSSDYFGGEQEDRMPAARPMTWDELVALIRRLHEALVWCSGSPSFGQGGEAEKGWDKLCRPLLQELADCGFRSEPDPVGWVQR